MQPDLLAGDRVAVPVRVALVLGGLVTFVFGAPVVIVKSMGGTILDFVILQVVGVSTFIACANSASFITARIRSETAITIGTALAFLSGLGFVGYALAGGRSPAWLIPIWIPMNIGMGLRGPTGFVAAIAAAPCATACSTRLTCSLRSVSFLMPAMLSS